MEKANRKEKSVIMKVLNFIGELLKEAESSSEVEEIEMILRALLSLAKSEKQKSSEIKRKERKLEEEEIKEEIKKDTFTEIEKKVILEIFASDHQKTLPKIAEILELPSSTAYSAFENSLRKIKEIYKEGVFPDNEIGKLLKGFSSLEEFLKAVKEKVSYKKLEFFR